MEKREEDWAPHYQSLLGLALEQCWDLDEFRKASQDTKHYCYKESLEAGVPSNLLRTLRSDIHNWKQWRRSQTQLQKPSSTHSSQGSGSRHVTPTEPGLQDTDAAEALTQLASHGGRVGH